MNFFLLVVVSILVGVIEEEEFWFVLDILGNCNDNDSNNFFFLDGLK